MSRTSIEEIIGILQLVIRILQQPGTDVVWSHYNSVREATDDIEQHIERLRRGDLTGIEDLTLLFAPTGSLQEIAINSGWGDGFLTLAADYDRALESLRPK